MKLPLSWLKEYVDVTDSVDGLRDRLTFSGVEVEGIETIGVETASMVVGEVLAVEPHPNADRLRVCRVSDGQTEHQVVCGAPNVAVGMKAAFAQIGAVMANGMQIKAAKIRGVASSGMLCAEDELGLGEGHDGILVLDPSWPAGTPLRDVIGDPEVVFDLEITPNRPDCLSILGLAREVAVLYGLPLRRPEPVLREGGAPASTEVQVDVEDSADCPRYTARIVRGLTVKPSPDWMQRRLRLCGIRPINNLVDVTNYVLLESGQPLHAFDRALLKKNRIAVRRARSNEVLVTLDEQARTLSPELLVIADGTDPVALAGVMGGAGSEIRSSTTEVLLESASFHPSLVRNASRSVGLRTESSHRFERGVDIEGVEWASRRAACLLAELGGGTVAPGIVDAYPHPAPSHSIGFRYDRMNALIGIEIDVAEVQRIFTSLGLGVRDPHREGCTLDIPSFRTDLTREVDLIEEIARVHGLDKIPARQPTGRIVPGATNGDAPGLRRLRDILAGLGLQETMNYSLVSEQLLGLFGTTASPIVLPNPISSEQSALRPSLVPQMAESLARNRSRQIDEAAFFEIGRTFRTDPAPGESEEDTRIGIGLLGPVGKSALQKRQPTEPGEAFLWLKGLIDALVGALGLTGCEYRPADLPAYERGFAAEIWLGAERVGEIGLLHRRIRQEWRISDPLPLAELRAEPLLGARQDIARFTPLAPYPPVSRDMALILDKTVTHGQVLAQIRQRAPKELESIQLCDIFVGESIGEHRRSLAYSLTYRSTERSLTDEETNRLHDGVKNRLKEALGAEIREG